MAHDGDGLPRLGLQVQIVENGFSGQVAEADVPGLHIPLHLSEGLGLGQVGGLLLLVQQGEHPLGGGQGGVDLVDDVGDLIDGPRELPGVEHEGGDLLHAHHLVHVEHRPHQADHGHAQVVDHGDGGAHGYPQGVGVPVSIGGGVVDGAEVGTHIILVGVGQDGLLPGEHFLHIAIHLAVGGAPFGVKGPGLFAHEPGVEDRGGQSHRHAAHQGRGDDTHHHEGPNHGH